MKNLSHKIRHLKSELAEAIPLVMFRNIRSTVNGASLNMGICEHSETRRNAQGEIVYKKITVGSFHHAMLRNAINKVMKGYMRGPVK